MFPMQKKYSVKWIKFSTVDKIAKGNFERNS